MAGDKTGALLACACRIGAVLVGAPAGRWPALAGFGAHLGLAFQLVDDLLGIWGAPEVTGKPVRADLRARKKSLPVVAALTSGTARGGRAGAPCCASPEALTEDDLRARGRPGWSRRPAAGTGPRPRPTRSSPRAERQPGRASTWPAERPGRARPAIAEFITARTDGRRTHSPDRIVAPAGRSRR